MPKDKPTKRQRITELEEQVAAYQRAQESIRTELLQTRSKARNLERRNTSLRIALEAADRRILTARTDARAALRAELEPEYAAKLDAVKAELQDAQAAHNSARRIISAQGRRIATLTARDRQAGPAPIPAHDATVYAAPAGTAPNMVRKGEYVIGTAHVDVSLGEKLEAIRASAAKSNVELRRELHAQGIKLARTERKLQRQRTKRHGAERRATKLAAELARAEKLITAHEAKHRNLAAQRDEARRAVPTALAQVAGLLNLMAKPGASATIEHKLDEPRTAIARHSLAARLAPREHVTTLEVRHR